MITMAWYIIKSLEIVHFWLNISSADVTICPYPSYPPAIICPSSISYHSHCKWKPFHFIFETLRSRYSNFLPLQRSLSPSDEKCKIFHSSSKMTQFLPERGEISKSPQNPRVLQKVCILSFIQEIFWGGVTELSCFSLIAFRCILLHNRPRCSATSQLHAICNMFLWFLLGQYDVDFFSQYNYISFVSKSILIFIKLQWIQSSQNYSFAMIFKTHDFHNIFLVSILVSTVASGCITSLWSDLLY